MSKTKPFGADRCSNCGEYGSHFVPPCFGDAGFFICEKKVKEPDMPNLATKNIFHFIVRLADQQEGDYLPSKIHSILGDLEEMAEDYFDKWTDQEALEKMEHKEEKK